jgi:mannose-6-phosphate isomerase-like protein (cupin superfamily)
LKPAIIPVDESAEYFFVEGCFINELVNTPDDAQVSIARARLTPGRTTRWHYLRDTTERYVIVAGQGRVEVGDLPPQVVAPGDVVLIPPGVRQRIATAGDDDLVFLAICSPRFTPDVYVDCDEEES